MFNNFKSIFIEFLFSIFFRFSHIKTNLGVRGWAEAFIETGNDHFCLSLLACLDFHKPPRALTPRRLSSSLSYLFKAHKIDRVERVSRSFRLCRKAPEDFPPLTAINFFTDDNPKDFTFSHEISIWRLIISIVFLFCLFSFVFYHKNWPPSSPPLSDFPQLNISISPTHTNTLCIKLSSILIAMM